MMRKLVEVSVLVLVVVLCHCVDALAGDTTGVEKGLVIYRDRILEPPFEFTGIESDTLKLNGIPYSPVRRYEVDLKDKGKLLPDSLIEKRRAELKEKGLLNRKQTSKEIIKKQHELSVFAHEKSRETKTYEEKKAVYARIMEESPLVDSTTIGGNTVVVYWKHTGPEPEACIISREYTPPLTEEQRHARRTRIRKRSIEEFWEYYAKGGTIVFGGIPGHLYHPRTEITRKAIEKLKRGDTLTTYEKKGSVFYEEKLLNLFKKRFKRMRKGE